MGEVPLYILSRLACTMSRYCRVPSAENSRRVQVCMLLSLSISISLSLSLSLSLSRLGPAMSSSYHLVRARPHLDQSRPDETTDVQRRAAARAA